MIATGITAQAPTIVMDKLSSYVHVHVLKFQREERLKHQLLCMAVLGSWAVGQLGRVGQLPTTFHKNLLSLWRLFIGAWSQDTAFLSGQKKPF